jgi:predicted nucleic acid-binding protein
MVGFLEGDSGADVELVDQALQEGRAVLPPIVLTELLSDPKLESAVASVLREIPVLETLDGFWERAGLLRAQILARGLRARLADALVAQSCIDHGISLIARDTDFRHFARFGRLALRQ